MGRRTRIVAMLGCLAAFVLALSGCGTSSGAPSAGDPAQIAPANSLLYIEITVRPQGSQRSSAQSALTKLLGQSPEPDLQKLIQSATKSSGLNFRKDIQPWLGQRIGLVFTAFTKDGVGVIAPTSNQSAALSALKKGERNAHLKSATYRGVSYEYGNDSGTPVSVGIISGNAVIAGQSAFRAIVDASKGTSLAKSSTFTSAFGQLVSGSLVRGYVNAQRLASVLASGSSALGGASPDELGSLLNAHGTPVFGVSATASSISFEVRPGTTHAASGTSSDVSALPGDSWLAIASPGVKTSGVQALERAVQTGPAAKVLGALTQRVSPTLLSDIFPALGPLQVSVQGTEAALLGVGLVDTPQTAAAGTRFVSDIYGLVAHDPKVSVTGKPSAFTVHFVPGSPIPVIDVAKVGSRILATFDEAFSSLLNPSTKLSSNSAFTSAKAALPAGSHVPFFINFESLATVAGGITSFQAGGSDHKTYLVLQRLASLILGTSPTGDDTRLVLNLR